MKVSRELVDSKRDELIGVDMMAVRDRKKEVSSLIEEITSNEDSVGTYSLEYLNPVVKAVGTSVGSITCEFSSAKPLRIEFKVANIGRIHFYLAPRVES